MTLMSAFMAAARDSHRGFLTNDCVQHSALHEALLMIAQQVTQKVVTPIPRGSLLSWKTTCSARRMGVLQVPDVLVLIFIKYQPKRLIGTYQLMRYFVHF